jgi:hypothetical protein
VLFTSENRSNAHRENRYNRNPAKSNIIYEWPERTKFTKTKLAWKKTKPFTTLLPEEESTAGKALMVSVAEYGDAWKDNFQGEELNDKTVTEEKVKILMTALVSGR